MYRKCVTEVSAEHQRQISETLLTLMEKIPFEDITVTQLCQTAGISRRIFYHLFNGKTGALHALVDNKILDIGRHSEGDSSKLLRFFRYWKEQKSLLDVLSENGMSGLLLERMISMVLAEDYDVIYWLERNGWKGSSQEIIIFGLSGFMGLVYSWYSTDYRRPPEEMAALAQQLIAPHLK